jgi:hypothetical protein
MRGEEDLKLETVFSHLNQAKSLPIPLNTDIFVLTMWQIPFFLYVFVIKICFIDLDKPR